MQPPPVPPALAFLNLGPAELMIIFVIVLLLFGAKKLPELAKGLGKSMTEFRRAAREVEEDVRQAADAELDKQERSKAAPPAKPLPPAGARPDAN